MATILDKIGHLGDLANHLTEVQLQAALVFNNLRVLRRWENSLFYNPLPRENRVGNLFRIKLLW
jgi:hypothetical protein